MSARGMATVCEVRPRGADGLFYPRRRTAIRQCGSSRGTQIDRASGRRGGGGAANAGRCRRWRRRLRHPRSPAAEQATALARLDTVADRRTSASSRSTPAGAPAPTWLPSAWLQGVAVGKIFWSSFGRSYAGGRAEVDVVGRNRTPDENAEARSPPPGIRMDDVEGMAAEPLAHVATRCSPRPSTPRRST